MIVNPKQFPIISEENSKSIISFGTTALYTAQHHLYSKFINDEYYYIKVYYFNNFENLDIKNIIPKKFFDLIIQQKLKLCIDFSHEALLKIFPVIYKNIVVKYSLSPKNILLIFGSPDYKIENSRIAKSQGCEEINVEWFNFFEMTMQNQNIPMIRPLKNKNHAKIYINLNRFWKPHRLALLFLLESKGLLDKGYNSFSLDENRCQETIISTLYDYENTGIIEQLKNGMSVIDKLPLSLDISDWIGNPNNLDHAIAPYFVKSVLSLVTETFYENKEPRFLSEKIFKPIFVRHPFILLSTPRSLNLLKMIGYQTFHPLVDESYDDENDIGKRMELATSQLERITNFSSIELSQFKEHADLIVEYNFKILRGKKCFIYQT